MRRSFCAFPLLGRLTFIVMVLPLPAGFAQGGDGVHGSGAVQESAVAPVGNQKDNGKAASDTPGSKDYSKEAFVIEQIESRFRFENDGRERREQTVRILVQSEAGVQRWGQLRVGYNSANERLEIPYVRVIKPDGSVVKAGDDAIQDLSAPIQRVAPVYTDYREKHVTVPGLRPGDVLEWESVTVVHTPVAAGQFWMQRDFTLTGIVLDEQLEINVPSGRAIKLKTKPGMDPQRTELDGRTVYRWKSSHLVPDDAKNKNSDQPKKKKRKEDDNVPAVQLTTFGSWEEVGRWYAELEKDRRQPSSEVRAQADALTKGMKTDLEKVQALYDYVATNFRYVSLSLGLARYQPHAAGDVLHNKYGDCKDKHTLLAALLEAEGMHSSAVLINSFRKLDPDVPSPGQFNHVITLLPMGKEEVWMDTTTEVAPFRMLTYQLRKKQGLVILQDGSHLEETPAAPAVADVVRTEVEGSVSESGKLDGKVKFSLAGDMELTFRQVLRRLPSTQWNTFIDGLNKKMGLGGEVSNVRITDPVATGEAFAFSYDVSRSNFLDWEKKKLDLKLPLSQFNPAQVAADVDEEVDEEDPVGAEPFELGPPNERSYKLKLELAARYLARAPVPVSVERDYGSYQSIYKVDANVLLAERKLVTRVAELPPARADDYRAFRRSVLADAAQVVNIESTAADSRSAPSGMNAAELEKSGNEARHEGNYGLAVSVLNRAVEAAPKSKTAWNDLGLAYFDSREDQLAINAFQKQIEIDPFHQFAYNNLGRVYLRQEKYEEAEKSFRKQIEINPLDKFAHANLGLAYVDWHKYEEAIPELNQAATITPNDADPQIRLGEAYLNLGQDDKAMAAFDKAVQISATPSVWNNIAYQLALKKAHLDVARRYAESALASASSSLRNVSLDSLNRRDPRSVSGLARYWDTLGWVEFNDGDAEKALKYVLSAWQLGQASDEADHLGQIYAKRGVTEKAEYFFAVALNARRPQPETRGRLAALLGSDAKVDAAVEKYRNELQQLRTIKLSGIKQDGSAEFFILLSPGTDPNATVEGAKFVSGEEKLKGAVEVLRAAQYQQTFPDKTPIKILRRGRAICRADSAECAFVLALPDDVSSVD